MKGAEIVGVYIDKQILKISELVYFFLDS